MKREDRNRRLGESFRQASRETVVIVIAWLVFLSWTGLVCGLGSRLEPDKVVETVYGIPRWAFFGVILPWITACGFTFWFSMFYMKDTDLDPDGNDSLEDSSPERP